MTFGLFAYLLVPSGARESIPLATMRLVFRADASQDIGSGHVMRCSAIAEDAISLGIECIFVGSIQGVDWLERRVQGLGFSNVVKPDLYLCENKFDRLIVDSYKIGHNDPFLSRNNWKNTIAIVDEATPICEMDMYIHPGFDSDWFKGDSRKLLTGPMYIPFRKSLTKIEVSGNKEIRKLVVFGGGTDTYNFGFEIAKILTHFSAFDTAVFFSDKKVEIKDLDNRFEVFDFGQRLDDEIYTSDLVLTTSGTSSLEIIARGLPLGIACAVDNQSVNYRTLGEKDMAAHIGERISKGIWSFDIKALSKLINDLSYRNSLIDNARGTLDLNGSRRILNKILGM